MSHICLCSAGPAAGNPEEGHTEDGNSEDRRGHLGWIIPVGIVTGLVGSVGSVIFWKQRKRSEEPQAIQMGLI